MIDLIKNKKNGFTVIELVFTSVIVGVVLSIAVAKAPELIESQHSKTAEKFLHIAQTSQNRYRIDHSGQYASNLADLDVNFANLNGFNIAVSSNVNNIASATRTGSSSSYMLAMAGTGEVTCTGDYCPNLSYTCGSTGDEPTGDTEIGEDTGTIGDENPSNTPTPEELLNLYQNDPDALIKWVSEEPNAFLEVMLNNPEFGKEMATEIENNPEDWKQVLDENPEIADTINEILKEIEKEECTLSCAAGQEADYDNCKCIECPLPEKNTDSCCGDMYYETPGSCTLSQECDTACDKDGRCYNMLQCLGSDNPPWK